MLFSFLRNKYVPALPLALCLLLAVPAQAQRFGDCFLGIKAGRVSNNLTAASVPPQQWSGESSYTIGGFLELAYHENFAVHFGLNYLPLAATYQYRQTQGNTVSTVSGTRNWRYIQVPVMAQGRYQFTRLLGGYAQLGPSLYYLAAKSNEETTVSRRGSDAPVTTNTSNSAIGSSSALRLGLAFGAGATIQCWSGQFYLGFQYQTVGNLYDQSQPALNVKANNLVLQLGYGWRYMAD